MRGGGAPPWLAAAPPRSGLLDLLGLLGAAFWALPEPDRAERLRHRVLEVPQWRCSLFRGQTGIDNPGWVLAAASASEAEARRDLPHARAIDDDEDWAWVAEVAAL